MIRILILLVIGSTPIFAQQCGLAVVNPETGIMDCTGGTSSISVSTLTDGATVNTSLLPTFQQYTCASSIAINSLVQVSGNSIVPAAGVIGVLGIARAACVGTGATTVALLGPQSCVAEGAITANNLMIPGTSDPTKCKDSGATAASSIPTTTPVIGIARAAASNGATFTVVLNGPHRFGTQAASSVLPDVVSVTGGSTTTIDIPLNTTLTNASQALPSCVTSGRVGFEPGGWSMNSGLTTMTVTFSPSAPASGSCTANLTGGNGGGAGSAFDSNTTTTVDGEVWVASGTAGKTAKRLNLTAAVTKMAAGIPSAATSTDVKGLWSGTCDNTTYLRGDGQCATPAGGGGSYTAGLGLVLAGSEFSLDSATQRASGTFSDTLNFSLLTPASSTACRVLTIAAVGAAVGDAVKPIRPAGLNTLAKVEYWVETPDVLNVQLCYLGTGTYDPGDFVFGATIEKVF